MLKPWPQCHTLKVVSLRNSTFGWGCEGGALAMCLSHFLCCWDKMPDNHNSEEERFIPLSQPLPIADIWLFYFLKFFGTELRHSTHWNIIGDNKSFQFQFSLLRYNIWHPQFKKRRGLFYLMDDSGHTWLALVWEGHDGSLVEGCCSCHGGREAERKGKSCKGETPFQVVP